MLGIPTANAAQFPTTQYVTNLAAVRPLQDVEVSMNRRYANKWSASIGGGYTQMNNFPDNYPARTPNAAGR